MRSDLQVDEEKFFGRGSSGGTMVSPTLEYVNNAINKRYNPSAWNIYAFHCSDGDNWISDMDAAIEASNRLKEICQFYGYCEIEPHSEAIKWLDKEGALSKVYDWMVDDKFKIVRINKKDDVWKAFRKFFGGTL